MACVPDASPLIILSKIERVELLPQLYGQVLVTPWVWDEAVIKGKAMGALDAAYLERTAKDLQFTKVKLTPTEKSLAERLMTEGRIHWGEAGILSVAKQRKAIAILDEKEARTVAVGMGVAHIGTVGVVYEAFLHKLVSYDELIEFLEKVSKVAWVSPDLVARIIRQASEVKK